MIPTPVLAKWHFTLVVMVASSLAYEDRGDGGGRGGLMNESPPRLFLFFSPHKWGSTRTHQSHSLSQDQSTVVQLVCSQTSCV